jgi:hypothetical protein
MTRMKVNPYFTFVLVGLLGCTPLPAPAPVPFDASDARAPIPAPTTAPDSPNAGPAPTADCEAACANIDAVGCLTDPDCARVLCAANADPRFAHYDLACLKGAMLPSDIAVCHVDCLLKNPSSLARPQ